MGFWCWKCLVLLAFVWGLSSETQAQTTPIPDPHFEQWLIDYGIDSDLQLNGHILTSDALAVTQLNITSTNADSFIQDVTGLEAFVNLKKLSISFTTVSNLPLQTLTQLTQLTTDSSQLTSLDLSHLPLLSELNVTNGGDVLPVNMIDHLDVSHNPLLTKLLAVNVSCINLNNQANFNLTKLQLWCQGCWIYPSNMIVGTVQIKVDQPQAAQGNLTPYSNWEVYHPNLDIQYTSDLSNCGLSTSTYQVPQAVVYPNPVRDGVLHIDSPGDAILTYTLRDLQGRVVREGQPTAASVSTVGLAAGTYVLQWQNSRGWQTNKVVVE